VSEFWNKVYSSDDSFFGDEPSSFALLCYKEFQKNDVKRILELGCGQGRDTFFFASKGIEVYTIDSSKVAVDALSKLAIEKNLPIHAMTFDARTDLPFDDNYFDAVYSHMFYNMRFTCEEISMLFKEVNRILKNRGLHFFSVRSDHDASCKKGEKVTDKIYDTVMKKTVNITGDCIKNTRSILRSGIHKTSVQISTRPGDNQIHQKQL